MTTKINKTKRALAEKIQKNIKALDDWRAKLEAEAPPPFYCSVDLRDSGHKIVPVDSNLYPAGFNNICPEDQRAAGPVLAKHAEEVAHALGKTQARRILILPESHTSNTWYAENLYYLQQIIVAAGYECRIGWYAEPSAEGAAAPAEITRLKSATDKELEAHLIRIDGGVVSAGGFVPDLILLNNDFSSGYPKPLDAVTQPILPTHALGWHSRKKSTHFKHYNALAAEFAAILDIDPWIVQIDTVEVEPVNFGEEEGIEQVAAEAEQMLSRIQERYTAHKVDQKPFVFVKNNAGTYGMGIMVVHSADEIRQMNRRTKNKMSVGKNRLKIESVAVQEGVPTATLVQRLPAEPVIYLFGSELIGGFLRTNTEKGAEDNLNSQGMVFKKLCMSDLRTLKDEGDEPLQDLPMLELVYGWVARISALATGREMREHQAKPLGNGAPQ